MSKKILGLDLGSNSIGWALISANEAGDPTGIIAMGSRIFTKAVEDKTPTPKNVNRRLKRLARRVSQRRAKRKQRMEHYLIHLGLLPIELSEATACRENLLNDLGDPYHLRAKALDEPLKPHQLGRVLLHLAQRRGFLSNKKILLGDMRDDPDFLDLLALLEQEETEDTAQNKEESAFKADIALLRQRIDAAGCRTLGEFLSTFSRSAVKRNRILAGGNLRTDRQMYQEEFQQIIGLQGLYHPQLTAEVTSELHHILFHQRPVRLQVDRIGQCSLEPTKKRCAMARLEGQRFRYWQDINNLCYFDPSSGETTALSNEQKQTLAGILEQKSTLKISGVKKALNIPKQFLINLENSKDYLIGNTTAVKIRAVLPQWDTLSALQQMSLVEDLLTIQKKSVLKNRLLHHWQFSIDQTVKLCLSEFEEGHSSLSLKAINKLLPHLEAGQLYSEARASAGYGYSPVTTAFLNRLSSPPETSNPIVNKALHELRRVVNALIAEYGKPDIIRLEMARDLEMNTKRYKNYLKRQKDNKNANLEAAAEYRKVAAANKYLLLRSEAGHQEKLRYRLWKDQHGLCAYSGNSISLTTLFSAEIEVDHILPYSLTLDDSYMNKVVCYAAENRRKGQQTPFDAFSGNETHWSQISQALSRWPAQLLGKKQRFFTTTAALDNTECISTQLNDTRYICTIARTYLQQLGTDITFSKGATTALLRKMWQLQTLFDPDGDKRVDHRHHALDAAIIAMVDRRLYNVLISMVKQMERECNELRLNRLHIDPPWPGFCSDLKNELATVIVSHAPQHKLAGGLHEDTGAGFIKGIGTVYRVPLNSQFTSKDAAAIYDPEIRKIVTDHLLRFGGDAKAAFAPECVILHKDGLTPIKRVRVCQSVTNLKKLSATKYGAKDKTGKIFKWMPYGNLHHIEIIQANDSNDYQGIFVTAMAASQRAKGIGQTKQAIISKEHGDRGIFKMALHIHDTVQLDIDGKKELFLVQKLGQLNQGLQPRPTLKPISSNTKEGKIISESVRTLMGSYKMKLLHINCIGKIIE